MEPDHAEYWRATDQVIDLAREIILRPDSVRTAQVDSFLDFRPGFLIRVVSNLATADTCRSPNSNCSAYSWTVKSREVVYDVLA